MEIKSKETREVMYTCAYTGGLLIPTPLMAIIYSTCILIIYYVIEIRIKCPLVWIQVYLVSLLFISMIPPKCKISYTYNIKNSIISYTVLTVCPCKIVPIPDYINVTVPNTQIVGQSLTLKCSVTTVRGITSRVDIVWNSDGVELNRTETPNITSTTDDMIEYMDVYTITLLKDTDINRTFHCGMIINSIPPVIVNSDVTLDVTGKCYSLIIETL